MGGEFIVNSTGLALIPIRIAASTSGQSSGAAVPGLELRPLALVILHGSG